MLIIEGSDCLGKTTLANSILKRVNEIAPKLSAVISHMTRPDENTFDFFTDYFPMIIPTVIQDRFHLGSLAYHDNKMTPENLRIIEGQIFSRGGFVVVLYASNFRRYWERLQQDTRSSILSKECQAEANRRFYLMVHDTTNRCRPIIDISYDVLPLFVSQVCINEIVDLWLARRTSYEHSLL